MSDEAPVPETTKSVAQAALDEVIAPLKELDERLAMAEAHLRNELDEILAERRKLRALLRVAEGNPTTKPGPKREPGKNATGDWVSDKTVESVLIAAASLDGNLTTAKMKPLVQRNQSTILKALQRLRERGQVRLTADIAGRGGGKVFVLTPRGREDAAALIREGAPVAANNGAT